MREQVTALQETLEFDVPPEQALPGSEQLSLLSRAVRARRQVRLSYSSEQKTATQRDFDPYGVVRQGGRWYSVGYCHLRRALRVFRLDRMAEVKLLEPRFEPPEDFDALEYVRCSVALAPLAYTAEVLLKTTLANAKRELYPNFVTLEPVAEGVTMRCTTDCLGWLARVLASLSFPWEVLEPRELKSVFREHVQRLLEQLEA